MLELSPQDEADLKESFGRYTQILLAQRLARNARVSVRLSNAMESEVEDLYRKHRSTREVAVQKMSQVIAGSESEGRSREAQIDELLLHHRSAVLKNIAASIVPS